jgi:flagellin-like hook-associated protein FlgL
LRAVEAVIQAAQVSSNSTLTATSPTAATAVAGGTLTVNGQNFTVTAGQSLAQIAQTINAQSGSTGITSQVVPDSNGAYHLQISNGMNAMTVSDSSGLFPVGPTSASPLSQSQLNSALQASLTTSNQAIPDLGNLQENISNASNELSSVQTQQSSFVTYLQSSLSNVKDVDTAQAAALVQQYQTQLQASYLAVSSLTKLSLAQYL